MATFEQLSSTRPATTDIAAHVSALVAGWKTAAARRKVYRRTVRELRGLSGRELADIGLNRSMIRSVAVDAARNSAL
ncbi:MAG: hypothetical protein DI498_02110 [Paracoccus denitrificans]|nr:MAG: hypothetical protein DI498_02110 [Paracoccus denitrificans]PZO85949.1 MAG: hypothetical protein DI633_02110 [Paracoccus denitrificans]